VDLELSRRKLRALTRAPAFGAVGRIATRLSSCSRASGRLLIVGTPTYEPWHLVAHWQSRAAHSPQSPTLVRHSVPGRAPAHLAVDLDWIAQAASGDTVLVIAPDRTGDELLERLADARRQGSTVLVLASPRQVLRPSELDGLAHDTALVQPANLEYAQHLLPAVAALL
jgi:hypothetical protein